ncbi:AcrR family transcriptional regulator [Streptosporangium becharense]|uniref:AcrR family transcriptional regulator n=1 Tax=Streptosporangium becharense TaxID=1816182 RepID=A0A7W9IHQ6_9ACTN|nr:TetR family transcriptional regulator [Streptosporangium becharense]MBB2912530.1 AcrR family transcriptional regulator [Streptosporangium becharense]MBB5820640.1 AcrR family transcriptional regulator [Streptosporangium becharense]
MSAPSSNGSSAGRAATTGPEQVAGPEAVSVTGPEAVAAAATRPEAVAGAAAATGPEAEPVTAVNTGEPVPRTAARRRSGRRPGSADTRGQILAAAREIFAEKGFDKATVRGIARQAGVDPALVHHYFDGKEGVFVAAMELPVNPEKVIPVILAGPRAEAGERLARLILTITSDPGARQPLLALVRTAMTNDRMVVTIREFMTHALLHRVAESLGVPPVRMEAAFAQLFGVVLVRYVFELEPMASAEVEELVELLGPTIQRYVDGSA